MPTLARSWPTSMSGPLMSSPSSEMSPVTRADGIVSFIRLRQRRNVDLPHPDGPMSAVTRRSPMSSETRSRASVLPYRTMRSRTRILADVDASEASEEAISMISFSGLRRAPASEGQTSDDVGTEDEHKQHERGGPCLAVPVLVR